MAKRKRKALRVPAGVVIQGRKLGGRFVSVEQLARLAATARQGEVGSVERLLRLAQQTEQRAAARHQHAAERHSETRKETDKRRRLDEKRRQDKAGQVVSRIEREAVRWSQRDLARAQRLAKAQRRQLRGGELPPEEREPGEPEIESPEWEIAYEYTGGTKGHDVDVSVRIARTDGAPIPEAEAFAIFKAMRASGGEPPAGEYGAWRSKGDAYSNLAALFNPIEHAQGSKVEPLYRVGAVKFEQHEGRCTARIRPAGWTKYVRCELQEHGGWHYARLRHGRAIEWNDEGDIRIVE
jgi:hypothetical protein